MNKEFWIRFGIWAVLACVLPCAFIIWRFDLFTKVSVEQYSVWTILIVAVIGFFAIGCLRYIDKGIKTWSMAKQIIVGFAKIIVPLLVFYYIAYVVQQKLQAQLLDLKNLLDTLVVIIGCEAVAIPVNPFPKYIYEETKGESVSLIDYAFKKYDERKGKE